MELGSVRWKRSSVGLDGRGEQPGSEELVGLEGRRARVVVHDALRRSFDVAGAMALLVVTAPLLAIGAVAVWRATGRPIFFGHARVGKGGRPFLCWKLRTMQAGAEDRLARDRELRRRYVEDGFKLPDDEDPRVLEGTGWLRRTHLDELPQLVNVLKGEMSLVGPRPLVKDELAHFGEGRWALLSQRPGLTGAWTAMGSDRPPYPERARLELDYVRNASLRGDLLILLRTVRVVLSRWAGA